MPRQARYLQLADSISQDIEGGVYTVGGQLPTEAQLCQEHNLSRFTVREALRAVEEMGLIRRSRGRASDVIASRRRSEFSVTLLSEAEFIRPESLAKTIMLEGPEVPTDEEAERLRLGDPQRWLRWDGLRTPPDGERPLAVFRLYLIVEVADVVGELPYTFPSVVFREVMDTHGVVLSHVDHEIFPHRMTKDEARILKASSTTLALRSIHRWHSSTQEVFEVVELINPADRYALSFRIEWPSQAPGANGAVDEDVELLDELGAEVPAEWSAELAAERV